MAEFHFDIGDWTKENANRFANASNAVIQCCKVATYEGAKKIADEVHTAASEHGNLADGLRVATMKTTADTVDTIIWFDGYDSDGVAFALKANAIESGRSTPSGGKTKAYHFFRNATRRVTGEAKIAMREKFLEEINKRLNGG